MVTIWYTEVIAEWGNGPGFNDAGARQPTVNRRPARARLERSRQKISADGFELGATAPRITRRPRPRVKVRLQVIETPTFAEAASGNDFRVLGNGLR